MPARSGRGATLPCCSVWAGGSPSCKQRSARSWAMGCRAVACIGSKPKLVAQIGFTEWTAGGKLRHPRFLGLRDDKRPQEVVWEG
jgi:ATP-dependent DNA ligase